MYTVYVKADAQGRIIAINSDAFLAVTIGWQAIDSGLGDRYLHAQGNYLPGDLFEPDGVCCWMTAPVSLHPEREAFARYQWNDEEWGIYLRTEAEKAAGSATGSGGDSVGDSVGLRVARLEQQTGELEQMLDMILTGVTMDE